MSDIIGAEVEIPVVYVRWKVDTWKKSSEGIHSPDFRFQGREWRLGYYYCNPGHDLYLCRRCEGCTAPFSVTVHVENLRTGLCMPELTVKNRIEDVRSRSGVLVWKNSDPVIEGADPEFCRNFSLRFLVVLKAEDILTDIDSKATQTEFNPPEGIEGEARKTASTSVQKLLDASPCLENLSQDLSKLMLEGSSPDVEFQCGDHSTKAHGLIVSSRSPVIASMLASDMVEGRTKIIRIPDMEPDIFRKFLRYLYSGQLDELTFETALSLYEAGDQYAVHGLARRCSEFLLEHLTVDNACEVLAVADAHSNAGLVEKVIAYMMENKVSLESDDWSAFLDDHPKLAVKMFKGFWKVSLK